ncbi:GUN4 domain-containing protein [Leptolyngbya sp. NK1-12]|uniref:GUN4 domain-containing protein n=1 Tax=Leptolyngbya sp. NK1-12 TaxID=2547451 RepID=A0AA96WB12_9CYAN|nr:GUN4 domain-containing protein [Leptolyngbya sp. NK1-12]WNZ21848.1 GUN4 domain-containing protein [Leptolyngbya sp. NK1-12]
MATVISTGSGILGYRLEAETAYCEALVERLKTGHAPFQDAKDWKLSQRWHQRLVNYTLDESTKTRVEQEVYKNILFYYQQVEETCKQRTWQTSRPQLRQVRIRLNLSRRTARAINLVVRWTIFDQQLFAALQRENFPLALTPASQQQLRQWQAALVIPNRRIPPVQMLRSGRNANYTRLWRRLNERDWQAANHETHECLLTASGQQGKTLQLIDVARIPKQDLQTIDQLWIQFSTDQQGIPQFGLSVQSRIWQQVRAAKKENLEIFARLVGWYRINSWINYESLDYSLAAEPGHLPALPYMGWWCWVGGMQALMGRMSVIAQNSSGPGATATDATIGSNPKPA